MRQTHSKHLPRSFPRACIAIAAAAIFATGCASVSTSGDGSGGSGLPGGSEGGGMDLPGGGSSGGGMSGGGMPTPGGSSGGGMSPPSMPGGSSGGGTSGGSSGSPSGGSSGSSGGSAGSGPMDSVEIPDDGSGGSDCDDGGAIGGGIGGGMGCDGDQSGSVGQFPGGDAERAEQLGKELDESVGDFDEVLMEEQREIETVGRNTEGYGTGSGGRSGGTISLGEQEAGAQGGGSSGGGGGGGGGASARSDPLEGMSEGEIEKRTPDDIAVIMDDDIVAKQLREAALAEEDPELRERLWDEYRKYKGM